METILLPLQKLSITACPKETQRERHWRTILNGPKPTRAWAQRFSVERAEMKKTKKAKKAKSSALAMAVEAQVKALLPALSFKII